MTNFFAAPAAPRQAAIASTLRTIFSRVLRIDLARLNSDAPFLELGADSLALVEALRGIHETFGVRLTIRQLFEQVPTITVLAAFLEASLPEEAVPAQPAPAPAIDAPVPAPAPIPMASVPLYPPSLPEPIAAVPVPVGGSGLERLLLLQLQAFNQLVEQQLQVLAGRPVAAEPFDELSMEPAPMPMPAVAAVDLPLPEAPAAILPPETLLPPGPVQTEPIDFPLTEAQVDLYTLAQLGKEASLAYNETGVMSLRGPLDLGLLRRALQAEVDRHESLRTVFLSAETQRVLPRLDLEVPLTEASGGMTAAGWLDAESRRGFDLSSGPLVHAAVFRLDPGSHLLSFTVHHIAADGLSIGMSLTEALAIYDAARSGRQADLPPAFQFRQYTGWLQAEIAQVEETAQAYWRERFRGVPVFEPPTDRPRPALRSFSGARFTESVGLAEWQDAQQLGRRHKATGFVTLLAAFTALLHRWTGQPDLVVGVPTSRRPLEGGDSLIGMCVDLVPIRSRTDEEEAPTFSTHLAAVRRRVLEAHDQGTYPFSRLLRALNPPHDPSRAPVVNVVFNMDQDFDLANAGGLEAALYPAAVTHVKFDLIFQPLATAEGLTLDIDYSTALFDASTLPRLLSYFRTLLAGAAADPGLPLSELPLLTPAERRQLLEEWSGAAAIRPSGLSIQQLVEAQAARDPEAPAIDAEEEILTYGELNRRANRLAWYLRSMGVGPEVRVGVCLQRSPDLVVALLAVLKAGGAYVPLDPEYPQERLELMLADSGAPILLTERRLAGDLPVFLALVIVLDEIPEIPGQPETDLPAETWPDSLAYIIYTSGSTGRPKGVAVPHRAVVRLVRDASYARLDPAETLVQLAPVSFDASTFEIWGALANGACLGVPAAGPLSLAEFAAAIERYQVTAIWITSALFQQIALEQLPQLRSVRQIVSGGDVLPPEPVRRVLSGLPGLRISNVYGPTENTTFTTAWPMDGPAEVPAGGWGVPIGRPISGTDVYIVDRDFRAVPPGSPGELVTGGEGLARGYHDQPERTAEKLIPHPFSARPGERLYRTGDRARFRPDGAVEFLGRFDYQVKVRGFRIEPGEIEIVLSRHPAVREVAVIARRGTPGDERLVAFVSPASPSADPTALSAELRAAVGESLPPYMVPSDIVLLPELPLNPSGKVDRKALAALEAQGAAGEREIEAPRNTVEEILAGTWSEVLKREQISVRDSFFDLGGHSLLATQVLSRVRGAFGVEVSLSAFFAEPTVAGLGDLIERARRRGEAAAAEPIRRVSRGVGEGPLPLSFAQQRLWFFDQFEGGSALYNVPLRIRIRGPLQARALASALAEVFRRHESLRTVFALSLEAGYPVQRILPASPPLPVIDLAGLPEPARSAESQRVDVEDAVRPFDLAAGPLLRTALVRLGAGEHRLFLHLHHITSDAWSIAVLGNEVAALYRTLAAGGRVTEDWPLPPLPIQYADFAVWQRQWFQGDVLERQLGYWRERLEAVPPALELPTDHPRPEIQTFRGTTEPMMVPPALTQEAERAGRRRGATLFMTLLAAFAVLLRRYSGQEDVLIGSPVANRNRADIEGLIGFFVNTLVLRVDLSGDPTFGELLDRVRQAALGAYAHQDLPFERLVEILAPERDLARNALFQVAFVLQNAPSPDLSFGPGLSAALEGTQTDTSKFDLAISLEEASAAGGLFGEVEYSTDLFERDTVLRFIGHYRTLLANTVSVAAGPAARISELALLSEAERRQLVVEPNRTRTSSPGNVPLHRLFEAQAERAPEAPAVLTMGGESLSYGELNRRANRLAWRLRALGVGPEALVTLHLERSPEMVVALLAVLKTGGAYVPLDPADPADRLRFLLEDSGAAVSLGRSPAPGWLTEDGGRFVDVAEATVERGGIGAGSNLRVEVDAEALAYVVYTSGSTGRPKGVAVPHRPVPRLAVDNLYLPLGPGDRISHLSNTAFDATVFEIWGALLNGGSLVVIPREVALSPAALGAAVDRHGITAMFLTTALFHQLAAELEKGGGPRRGTLRALLFGGEAVDPRWARAAWKALSPAGTRLMDVYGPTEGTVFTTFFPVGPECRSWPAGMMAVPIGRPIGNTRVHVLDERLAPVPTGVPGELWIGGDGLARGYLDRPGLTAERFGPDPFAGELDLAAPAGGRLYRTGDRVRWRPDGDLEFLGRLDQQVKIRGFRIEPGEVEAALAAAPGVEAAAVLVRADRQGGRSLAACVVRALGAESLGSADLRAWLESRLPGYMVPSRFAFVDALPLTPSGKVDRKSLASAPFEAPRVEVEDESPRSPVEEVVASLWADLLDLSGRQPGLHDNFFESGGHSLLATLFLSRLRVALGVDLTLVAFFQEPTIAGIAHRIAESRLDSAPPLVASPGTWEGEYPLSFAQERLWFLDRLTPGFPVYNMPVRLRFHGPVRIAAVGAALAEITRRHQALRTVFLLPEGQERPVQRILPPPAAGELPVVDLTGLPPARLTEEAARIDRQESRRPFDLERGPLLQSLFVRLRPAEAVLLVVSHHIVSDGWSLGVLIREILQLYRDCAAGEPSMPPGLPELPIQYGDYAAWQRRWLAGGVLEQQLAYWRERLAGYPGVLELPADRTRPAVQTTRGGAAKRVTAIPTEPVHLLARQREATPFMVLLAAFQALLLRYTGQEDVLVGSPVAGRNRSEIEPLIGFFVNLLALRTDLSGDPGFDVLLARAKEASLGAYAHQDLPFEALVEALTPERDLSRGPLVQVTLTLKTGLLQPRVELEPGVTATLEELHTETAKFDFGLFLEEGSGGTWLTEAEYASDLFEAATADRILAAYETLLAGALTAPQAPLSDLPLLGEEERRQILEGWSWTGPADSEATVHGLIAEQAVRHPGRVALVALPRKAGEDVEEVTYADLVRRAKSLAGRLRGLGAGPDVPVGVCLERSAGLVVALLAVLEAGGAYVPLDPDYPEERLSFMLRDSGVPVLVTSEELAHRLPEMGGIARIFLNGEEGEAAAEPAAVSPDNAVYVIYTSGSTGTPKGAVVPHRGVVRLLRDPRFSASPDGETWLQLAPISFDASVLEIWCCLANGGRLVIPPAGRLSLEEIGETVESHGVTSLHLVAALFTQMAGVSALSGLRGLRHLLAGGDVLPPEAARRGVEALPGCSVSNDYGPTENSTITTYFPLTREKLAGDRPVPIGRPVLGTDVYVVDAAFRPVPAGVPGELVTGGDGLARGYHGRPDLTAERFVPHPFGKSGERLYRTGDLARFLADGNLAFLGRADRQVKVRGFRIEPAEIESALAHHPDVGEAAVVARRLPQGDESLVAFVTPRGEVKPECAVLGLWLSETLPPYMIPSVFAGIDELPRTPSGKIDRGALVRLPLQAREAAPSLEPPRTPLEEIVAGIFAGALGRERVGLHERFFDLGGHSLLATVLLSRLRAALGVELTLVGFFQEPTVAGLARRIELERQEKSGLAMPPMHRISREDRERGPRLSFAQERLWLVDQLQPGGSAYNSFLPVQLKGPLDLPLFERVLSEIVRRHEVLRTTFAPGPDGPVQVIAEPEPWTIPVVDLSALPEKVREDVIPSLTEAEALRPFDLARGPLRRATLLHLEPESHALLFNLHHSVCDGWSLDVLTREVGILYRAYAPGSAAVLPPFPELPIQYADFSQWQRDWLRGDVYAAQLDYWRGQLGENPPALELPTDRPRPPFQTTRGGFVSLSLPAERMASLAVLARTTGGTLFTLLLAAFQAVLHRHSGQDRVSVGTPVAGRTRPEIERLIGFFVNTLVISADLSGNPPVRELLARVRDSALGAFDHQDFPFEKLVAHLEARRDPSRQPLFQAMLVLQNNRRLALELPGLELSIFSSGGGQSLFDLVLTLGEEDGGGMSGVLSFNADLFDQTTMRRLSGHIDRFLEEMAAGPDRPLSALTGLTLLSEAERQQLLCEWPDRTQAYALDTRREPLPIGVWGEIWEGVEGSGEELAPSGERARFKADGTLDRQESAAGGTEADPGLEQAARQADLEERRRQLSSRRSQLSPERLAVLRKWGKGRPDDDDLT